MGDVTSLALEVDTRQSSLGRFGALVPNLETLSLDNSHLASIRDLGTGFNSLRVVRLAGCGVEDLDGISAFSAAVELHLGFNLIRECHALTMLGELEVLDLRG